MRRFVQHQTPFRLLLSHAYTWFWCRTCSRCVMQDANLCRVVRPTPASLMADTYHLPPEGAICLVYSLSSTMRVDWFSPFIRQRSSGHGALIFSVCIADGLDGRASAVGDEAHFVTKQRCVMRVVCLCVFACPFSPTLCHSALSVSCFPSFITIVGKWMAD